MYAGIFCPEASENHLLHGDAGALGYPVECWGDFARLCTLLSHLLPGMLKCRDMCTGNVSKLNHVWLHLASLGHPLDPNMRTLEKKCRQWFPKVEICGLRENVCFFPEDAILHMFGTPGVLQMGTAGALMGNSKRSTWTAFQHRHSRLISE